MTVPIVVRLDVMLALRKMRSRELAQEVGITEANLSLLKSGKVKGVRFETLEKICAALDCQPGDILEYAPAPAPEGERKGDTQPEANAPPTKPASADP